MYRELSNYSLDEAGNERENLMASFPIIEKNWESISSLGGVIVRRSKVELRNWGATSQVGSFFRPSRLLLTLRYSALQRRS